MLPTLSSLSQRTRAAILAVLLVVLPLQSVVQLAAGIQGYRHVHTGVATLGASSPAHGASTGSGLLKPLRALLDRLHADQDPRLKSQLPLAVSRGPSGELHEHGGVFHRHSVDTHDVLEVGDVADESTSAGMTAFLAWLPTAVTLLAAAGDDHPAGATVDWRDRVVAPPRVPPRA